ncbi:MAG: YdcF family protein [Bacteroidetes bacterium]|nr:YdcF family protein [Bacteroidota bacterium]MBS1648592.1 YdcF family protein [Bacteroidota bacterium]
MFFYLSKILLFVLIPFWWVVILLIWSWITKNIKTKKRLHIAIVFILIVFTNPFLFNKLVNAWQPTKINLKGEKYSAAILLSGIGGYDEQNNFYIGASGDRFIQTAQLYHQGIVQKIVVTGGSGSLLNNIDEAQGIKQELLKTGIPDSVILLERKARNTYENAIYSKQILDSVHLQAPYVLVTSAMHMPRAKKSFDKAKIPVIIYPSDFVVYNKNFTIKSLIPEASIFFEWGSFLKEIVGYGVYKITGKL